MKTSKKYFQKLFFTAKIFCFFFFQLFLQNPIFHKYFFGNSFFLIFFPSVARPKAERSGELGWSKKNEQKKRNHYDDDDDDDDQFCTRSNILPFFFKFSHLCSFFSLQKVFMVSTTYQLFAKDILTKSFVRKKMFFEEKLENIFRKKNKNIFFEKKIRIFFFFFEKYFWIVFFFEKMFLDFNLKTTDWDRLTKRSRFARTSKF